MKTEWIKCALAAVAIPLGLGASTFAAESWLTDYPAALALAKKENKLVLLSFGGSDWCEPCIIMKKRVFNSDAFKDYAAQNLITVDVDFPQGKPQPEALSKQNLALAIKYKLTDPTQESIETVPVLILATPDEKPLAVEKMAFFFPSQFIGWAKKAALKAQPGI
jgi:thioredoxin-related protein